MASILGRWPEADCEIRPHMSAALLVDCIPASKKLEFVFRPEQLQVDLLDTMVQTAIEHVVAPALSESEGLPRLYALVEHWLGWRPRIARWVPDRRSSVRTRRTDGEVRTKVVVMKSQWRLLLLSLIKDAALRRRAELLDDGAGHPPVRGPPSKSGYEFSARLVPDISSRADFMHALIYPPDNIPGWCIAGLIASV